MRLGRSHGLMPIEIPPRIHRGDFFRALNNDTFFRFRFRHINGIVQQRLVGNDPVNLCPAGSGYDNFRLGIVDPGGQLIGRKSTKNHGMNGAQTCTGQHGHHGLRNHGHIDNNPIALLYPRISQGAGKGRHLIS